MKIEMTFNLIRSKSLQLSEAAKFCEGSLYTYSIVVRSNERWVCFSLEKSLVLLDCSLFQFIDRSLPVSFWHQTTSSGTLDKSSLTQKLLCHHIICHAVTTCVEETIICQKRTQESMISNRDKLMIGIITESLQ